MSTRAYLISGIRSGGQTGVDRAALDIGLQLGVPVGGWCPRGRLAEDGIIEAKYPLLETSQRHPSQRTTWNVRDSDATLIMTCGTPTGGTALTIRMAQLLKKPYLIVDLNQPVSPVTFIRWIQDHTVDVLNIAGPRESTHPGVYSRATAALRTLLTSRSSQDRP